MTFAYDAVGNLTNLGPHALAYDFEDRLIQLVLSNSPVVCAYDGFGNRLQRTIGEQATRFVLDRAGALTQVLIETDTNGSPTAYYIYGIGLAQRITPDGTVTTYHFDVRGSTVALTDSGGNVTDAYAFDSFGVLANSEGDSPQPFRYLGRHGIMDDGNGLYHARARYFNPELGRFLTKDPVTGKDSDSHSLNRYVYALNNPLRWLDVSGLSAQEGANSTADILDQINFADLPRELLEQVLRSVGTRLELFVDTSYGRITIGELRISPGNTVDLRAIGGTLRIAANGARIYGIFESTLTELRARGIDFSTFGESILNIEENLAFARDNRLQAWQSVNDAFNSYNAVLVNVITFDLFQIRGDQVQQGVNAYNNFFQLP